MRKLWLEYGLITVGLGVMFVGLMIQEFLLAATGFLMSMMWCTTVIQESNTVIKESNIEVREVVREVIVQLSTAYVPQTIIEEVVVPPPPKKYVVTEEDLELIARVGTVAAAGKLSEFPEEGELKDEPIDNAVQELQRLTAKISAPAGQQATIQAPAAPDTGTKPPAKIPTKPVAKKAIRGLY